MNRLEQALNMGTDEGGVSVCVGGECVWVVVGGGGGTWVVGQSNESCQETDRHRWLLVSG